MILHIPGEDCDATLGLFVDEEPPAPILERGAPVVHGARLSAPSGHLAADGLEFMTRPGEERKHSEPEVVVVPRGEYEVEVRELLSWKVRHRAEVVRRGSRVSDRWAHKLVTGYAVLALLLIPANAVVLPGVMILWQRRGWRSAVGVAALILIVDTVVFGGFRILELARKRFPALSRMSEAETAFDLENPDIAVILRHRPAEFSGSAPAFAKIRLC